MWAAVNNIFDQITFHTCEIEKCVSFSGCTITDNQFSFFFLLNQKLQKVILCFLSMFLKSAIKVDRRHASVVFFANEFFNSHTELMGSGITSLGKNAQTPSVST